MEMVSLKKEFYSLQLKFRLKLNTTMLLKKETGWFYLAQSPLDTQREELGKKIFGSSLGMLLSWFDFVGKAN